jgi:hypothetical protein
MPSGKTSKAISKSVRFTPEETSLIEEVSRREHLPEGTLMRKLVLEGIARLRLDRAIADYQAGDLNLGEAARSAGVSVRRMMTELDRRGVDLGGGQDILHGLESLAQIFGASPALRETIAERRTASR